MRVLLLLAFLASTLHAAEMPINWEKARALHQRATRGEALSAEEQKYYDEARRQRPGGGERKQAAEAPPAAPTHLLPLTELTGTYQGQDGGLYGGGKNEPSPELAARAQSATARVRPLDPAGKPVGDGRIVLLSIGMSNTTQEFSAFKRLADTDARKAAQVTIVDGAQGGQTAQIWAQQDRPWEEAARRIAAAGASPEQVQVLWLKQANARPTAGWPAETDRLRDDLRTVISRARGKFPHLRLIFLSSRTYAGYAKTLLNPEPYAYESAFAVRAVVRDQSADGPVLLWGPYLWANGEQGRARDGFQWLKEDTAPDGTHPSRSGQEKVGRLLLDFFASNPAAQPWFTKQP